MFNSEFCSNKPSKQPCKSVSTCLSCTSGHFQTVFLLSLFKIAKWILITKNTLPYSGFIPGEVSTCTSREHWIITIVRVRWRCTPHTAHKRWERTASVSSSKTQRSLINDTRPAQQWSLRCTVWNYKETLSSLRLTCFLHFKHIQCVWLIHRYPFVLSKCTHSLWAVHPRGRQASALRPWIKCWISRPKGTWAPTVITCEYWMTSLQCTKDFVLYWTQLNINIQFNLTIL